VTDARDLWKVCSEILRSQVSDATWRASFANVEPLSLRGDELRLAVPSDLVRDRLSGRYQPLLDDALRDAAGAPVRVVLEVRLRPPDDPEGALPAPRPTDAPPLTPSPAAGPPPLSDPFLANRFTFDNFVIGPSNRFAHAAALSVAEAPARSYNPLFIYGGAGLGKTHLLQAIGNYVTENFPRLHVRYVSTETFMNEFVETLRAKDDMGAFRRRYRECDVLLLDDVQFMDKKESLQEELFHTFNTLYGSSKQIVLTSDRPPKAIANLEDRLRSRLLSGLLTDIQPPELETRLAILRAKAEQQSSRVENDVLEFIATNVTDNIRELEGALIRVTAFAALNHQPLTRSTAERVLADIVAARQPRRITARQILEATAEHFGFTVDELCGPSRRRPLVVARQIGMYLFRELTDFSYPAIAREFGGRDHTTVIHAVDKISRLMRERRAIYEPVTDLILKIKGSG
jgi:chromosomal replication initiator protein